MDVELLSEEDEDDDAMLEAPFKRIHTPTSTVRSSTNTSTDSPSSKFKKIRVKEEANISEEVDTYLYHLSSLWNGDNKFGECPFFTSAMIKLDVCQRKLLQAFECRFSSMDDSTLWTSLFDMLRYCIFQMLKKVLQSRLYMDCAIYLQFLRKLPGN